MEIGSRLKKAREVKRLSQHDVAHKLGVSQKTLSNFESGKSIPNIFQLVKMAEIYELDILELLEKEGILLTKSPPILPKSIIMFSNLNKKLIQN
jgi:transcriptional regulator with XRE-family HTH domain